MKKNLLRLTLTLFLEVSRLFVIYAADEPYLKLWYDKPAAEWMQATPVGNGRLGAMIFGGAVHDRIALNEITMWAGQPDPNQEIACGKEKLAEIRKLFFDGKIKEGNDSSIKYLSGKPNTFGTHIPAGDLDIKFDMDKNEVTGYRRELDLENSITTVSFRAGGINFIREYFCSNPDNILVIRTTADKPHSISCSVSLNLQGKPDILATDQQLSFTGRATSTLRVKGFPDFSRGGVDFSGIIRAYFPGGSAEPDGKSLKVTGADELILYIDIRTSYMQRRYRELCAETVDRAAHRKYDEMKKDHTRNYQQLFNRMEISLGSSDAEKLPTDIRLDKYNHGSHDPGLCALFLQYNRYLLISCSRENSPLPANLQGLWNDNLAANMPWTCDYHLDINTQQNYWASDVTNLSECNIPLFNYIKYLSEAGEKTACKVYGSPGWVAHTVTNIWGYTAPGEWPGWGLFPAAGTWIALHLWQHYLFTKDRDFLDKKAYPILRKNAEFFLDYMVTDPSTGYLMTGPCTSPENSFRYGGDVLSLSMMPAGDRVLIYELFNSCIESSRILDTDIAFREKLKEAVERLPPIKISKTGEIQEWFYDYEKAVPNHRHTTHLLSLYPFSQISVERTPDLADAALKTIQYRLNAPGWEDVEWSRANMINFYARLKMADEALGSINILLKNLTRENLLTFSVSGIAGAKNDIFVLDGNEAAASGIAEMLIQSQDDYIEFLPALPAEWNEGHFNGLCVRGGAEAAAEWKNGKIIKASLKASTDNSYKIRIPELASARLFINGTEFRPGMVEGNIITTELKKNDVFNYEY